MSHPYFVSQKRVSDCGIASLLMILKLKGINIEYDKLKKILKVDKEGTRAYDIIKVSSKFNLIATGYKNYKITNNSYFPLIAHTIKDNMQHYVVVLDITNKYVHILDPAVGDIKLKKDEFKKIYTGIVILFKNKNVSYNSIINIKSVMIITILILFFFIITIIYSYLLSYSIENSRKYLVLLLLAAVIKELVDYYKNMVLLKSRIKIDKDVTVPTIKNIFLLPLIYYQKNSNGSIISKIGDLSKIKEMFFVINEVLYINFIIIFFSVILLIFISLKLFIINVLILLFIFLYNNKFYNKNSYKSYDLQIQGENLTKDISSTLDNIEVVKNIKKETHFINKILKKYHLVLNAYKEISKLYINKNFINKLMGTLLIILLLYIFKNSTYNLLFITYVENIIINATYELCSTYEIYSDYIAAKKRLNSIYKENINIQVGNRIDIKNINFYNILLKKGDMLHVEGKTGSGKTTFFKKFIEKNDFLFINGKKINNYEINDIRTSITYVSQKSKLFNTNIINNITLGSKLKIRKNAYKLITKHLYKNGIDENYVVDNQNNNLSGGEIKLILILQTLNNGGDVIIFDETTNELDNEIEKDVLLTLKREYKDKIFIVISHKNNNKHLFNKHMIFSSGNKYKTNRRINEKIKY